MAVEIIPNIPSFAKSTIPVLLKKQSNADSSIEELKSDNIEIKNSIELIEIRLSNLNTTYKATKISSERNDHEYEEAYRRELAERIDYPDLFGLDVHPTNKLS